MNLLRLVDLAREKLVVKTKPVSSAPAAIDASQRNAWADCLTNDAPIDGGANSPIESHPLSKACTPEEYLSSLVKTIEGNILPHIVEHHLKADRLENGQLNVPAHPSIDGAHIDQLLLLLLQDDATPSANYVKELFANGIELEEIYLNLLTPVARKLGEQWESDEADFTQVTVALWRIKQLMYDLSPVFQEYAEYKQQGKSVMLVPLPGSQHTLGLFMVSEFFARAGWRVWGELAATEADILRMAKTQWFDVVGLSASVREQFPDLKRMITEVRSMSLNPHVGIMIGSPVFNQNPELVEDLGADMVGVDAVDALEKATFHVEQHKK
jgi:MerR family transcriptional regulator, light-induced transcriptional regulator